MTGGPPTAPPVTVGANPLAGCCCGPQAGRTEHARLTDGTADLWRQLVHLCWETPT